LAGLIPRGNEKPRERNEEELTSRKARRGMNGRPSRSTCGLGNNAGKAF